MNRRVWGALLLFGVLAVAILVPATAGRRTAGQPTPRKVARGVARGDSNAHGRLPVRNAARRCVKVPRYEQGDESDNL